jgi:hypothetical protein
VDGALLGDLLGRLDGRVELAHWLCAEDKAGVALVQRGRIAAGVLGIVPEKK